MFVNMDELKNLTQTVKLLSEDVKENKSSIISLIPVLNKLIYKAAKDAQIKTINEPDLELADKLADRIMNSGQDYPLKKSEERTTFIADLTIAADNLYIAFKNFVNESIPAKELFDSYNALVFLRNKIEGFVEFKEGGVKETKKVNLNIKTPELQWVNEGIGF